MIFGATPFAGFPLSSQVVICSVTAEISSTGFGIGSRPKNKRYFVKHKEQLLVFDSRRAADRAIYQIDKAAHEAVRPAVAVNLPEVAAYAEITGKIDSYNAAYNSAEYARLMVLFEQMQDDEDIEMLLLAL